MSKPFIFRLAVFLLLAFLTNCSSVKKKALGIHLENLKDKKAEKVHYLEPVAPYQKQEHPVLDAFWWNSEKNSSISYFSNCSKIQKTLKQFQKESFPSNAIILESSKTKNSLYTLLEIPHLNKKTYSGVHTLKKRNCYFNINLVTSSPTSFKTEELIFKIFIKNFKVIK